MVLGGITRQKIQKICHENRIAILEQPAEVSDLTNFDAAFLTGTSPKVLPIRKINSRLLEVNHKLTQQIIEYYDTCIHNYLREYNV